MNDDQMIAESTAVRLLSFAFALAIVPVCLLMQWVLRWLYGLWPETTGFLSRGLTGFVLSLLLTAVMSSVVMGLLYCIIAFLGKSNTSRGRIDELRSELSANSKDGNNA